jgi:RND family efflux transporter MFP subunit
MTRWLTAAGAVIVAVAIAVGVAAHRPTAGDIPTIEIESGEFNARVTADGTLEPVRSTPLTAPVQVHRRMTVAWVVADGTPVHAGDVVVRFDPRALEEQRKDGLSERRIADHRISSAEVSREVTLTNLDRDAEVARLELEHAREFETSDSQVFSRMEILESRIDTELAERTAEHAEASKKVQARLSDADDELLRIARRAADLQVQQADDGLSALEITAPHGGMVMLERDWRGNPTRVGDTAWPGRPIAKIPDLSEMEAEVYVLEADAGGLAAGQTATVRIEAHPDRPIAATVKSVAPIAQQRGRGAPVQYFLVVLQLDHTEEEIMKPGARVSGEILLADLDDVLTVPRQAIGNKEGSPVVWRKLNDGFEAVEVELGAAAAGRVVVTSGLEAGDVIALRDPAQQARDGGDDGATRTSGPGLLGGMG